MPARNSMFRLKKIKYEVITYGSSGIFGLVGIKKSQNKSFLSIKKKKEESTHQSSQQSATSITSKTDQKQQ